LVDNKDSYDDERSQPSSFRYVLVRHLNYFLPAIFDSTLSVA